MPYSDVNPELDTASAIAGMADVLDKAADAVSSELSSPNVTAGDTAELTRSLSLGDGAEMNTAFDPSAGVPGGPEAQPFSAGTGVGPSEVKGTINQEVDVTNLGDQPSLQALEAAISSGMEGDAPREGGPSGAVSNLMGGEEVAEEATSPGADAATFLSDFDRGMSAQSPEQGLVAKIDALQNQAAQLQAQAAGFDPSAAVPGGAPAQAIDPLTGAVNTVGAEGVAGGWGGNAGWNNPNTFEGQLALAKAELKDVSNIAAGVQTVQKGYPQPSLNVSDYRGSAEQSAAAASGGGQGWVNPNASFEELEAQFSTSPQSVTAEQAATIAPTGGGQGWVDPNDVFFGQAGIPDTGFITDVSMAPQTQAQKELSELISLEEGQATTLAPKYSGETVGYQTHAQMYPDHKMKAAMAGVASIKAMFDGTHKAWIDDINQDMKDRNIELTHEINGVRTGKHSSADWKEYNDLFTVGEDGVPRDSNGVPMPGTEKQAQAGMGGVLQTLFGGVFSGAQNLFKPKTPEQTQAKVNLPDLSFLPPNFEDITPEQMAEMEKRVSAWYNSQQQGAQDPYANLGYPDYASGNIPANIRQPATVGDDTRGDNEIDIIRSNYAWAASLPRGVLFNALRYPDYLRLLIEYDADGKDLPLTVPTWILEGTARPAEDEERTNPFANHPAMKTQELTWAT